MCKNGREYHSSNVFWLLARSYKGINQPQHDKSRRCCKPLSYGRTLLYAGNVPRGSAIVTRAPWLSCAAEGVRNRDEGFMVWWSAGSKVSRLLCLNGPGISALLPARKLFCSRQKAVTPNLSSLDAVYRQVLAPENGTTLSGSIRVVLVGTKSCTVQKS